MNKAVYKPSPKQWQALEYLDDQTTRMVVYGGAAGGGKSYLGCWWIIKNAIKYPNTAWGIGRSSITSLLKTTFITFQKVLTEVGVKVKYNGQTNVVLFPNGSRVFLLDMIYRPADPLYTRIGGLELTGALVDEGGESEKEAVGVLRSRLGRCLNSVYGILPTMLITCNPSKNWLYVDVYKIRNSLPEDVKFIPALIDDNPDPMAQEYKKSILATGDNRLIRRLIYGDWEYDDNPLSLFDYQKITDLHANIEVQRTGEKFITADVAMEGSDMAVIISWDGLVITEIIEMPMNSGPELVTKIIETADKIDCKMSNIAYDSDGVGNYLRGYLRGAIPINNNGKAIGRDNYANLKSQMAYTMRDLVNKNLIFLQDTRFKQKLYEELEQIRSASDDMRKLEIESKSEVKKRLGRSPDFSDAFLLRSYWMLKDKPKSIQLPWA